MLRLPICCMLPLPANVGLANAAFSRSSGADSESEFRRARPPPRPRPYARRGRRVKILCKSGFPRLIRKRPCISCVLEMPCSNTPSQHQTQFRWAIHAGWEFCTSAHARKGLSDIFLFFGESRPPLACNAARSKPSPKQNRNGLSTESRP